MPGAIEVDEIMEPVIEVFERCVGDCSNGVEEMDSIALSNYAPDGNFGTEMDISAG